ncbi:MAG: patatin-like phospholipase family protein, partial [Bacteroidota bacterium]
STGSLMAPLVALRNFDKLATAYTSVTQDDIFSVNPFNSDGSIKYLKVGWRLIKGAKTVGESENMLKTIRRFFTSDDYDSIKKQGLEFAAAVTCLTDSKIYFQSTNDFGYDDMVDWAWASANTPMFMSTLEKNGKAWVDGGLRAYLPLTYAVDKGAEVIDVIVHNHPGFSSETWVQKGSFLSLLFRILSVYYAGIATDNMFFAIDELGIKKEHELNFYFMAPEDIHFMGNDLVLDQAKMKTILEKGYQSVLKGTINKQTFKIGSDGKVTGPI